MGRAEAKTARRQQYAVACLADGIYELLAAGKTPADIRRAVNAALTYYKANQHGPR